MLVRVGACLCVSPPRDDTVNRRQLQDALQEFDFLCDMESYPKTLRRPQQHRSLELSDAIMPLQESPPAYSEPELIHIPHKHSSSSSQSQRQSSSSSSEPFSLPIRNPFQFQPVPVTSSPSLGVKETPPASAVDQQLHRPVLTLPPVVLLGGRRAEEDESVPASPLVEYPEDDDEYLYSGTGGGGGLQPSHSHHSNNSSSAGFCVEVRRFFHLNPFFNLALVWLWLQFLLLFMFCFVSITYRFVLLLFCYCPSYPYCKVNVIPAVKFLCWQPVSGFSFNLLHILC